jgi:predicted small metal-binding protein
VTLFSVAVVWTRCRMTDAREGPMKSFACGDVVPGCDARFVCSSDDEILVSVARHAADVHAMAEVPVSLQRSVRDHIVLV